MGTAITAKERSASWRMSSEKLFYELKRSVSMFRAFETSVIMSDFLKPFPWVHFTGHKSSAQCGTENCIVSRCLLAETPNCGQRIKMLQIQKMPETMTMHIVTVQ